MFTQTIIHSIKLYSYPLNSHPDSRKTQHARDTEKNVSWASFLSSRTHTSGILISPKRTVTAERQSQRERLPFTGENESRTRELIRLAFCVKGSGDSPNLTFFHRRERRICVVLTGGHTHTRCITSDDLLSRTRDFRRFMAAFELYPERICVFILRL